MTKIKLLFSTVFGSIFGWFGILSVPVFLLLGCNIIDYITGLAAAKYRDPNTIRPISSYKSVKGIIKKVCMYLLIVVGWMVDVMIHTGLTASTIKIQIPYIVSTVIACWLVFNEMLSILENMEDIGVDIPPFMKPLLRMMRQKQESVWNGEGDKKDGCNCKESDKSEQNNEKL